VSPPLARPFPCLAVYGWVPIFAWESRAHGLSQPLQEGVEPFLVGSRPDTRPPRPVGVALRHGIPPLLDEMGEPGEHFLVRRVDLDSLSEGDPGQFEKIVWPLPQSRRWLSQRSLLVEQLATAQKVIRLECALDCATAKHEQRPYESTGGVAGRLRGRRLGTLLNRFRRQQEVRSSREPGPGVVAHETAADGESQAVRPSLRQDHRARDQPRHEPDYVASGATTDSPTVGCTRTVRLWSLMAHSVAAAVPEVSPTRRRPRAIPSHARMQSWSEAR
jgi:hypothetical protein